MQKFICISFFQQPVTHHYWPGYVNMLDHMQSGLHGVKSIAVSIDEIQTVSQTPFTDKYSEEK